MIKHLALMLGLVVSAGCGQLDAAPPSFSSALSPEVLFLVKNEVVTIRLDGTARRSLGRVGDDRRRTGFPRFLPDGRIAVLGDETGGIFPYVGTHEAHSFTRLTATNVTINDSLCGAKVAGESRIVFTTSPFTPYFPMSTRLYRMNPDDPQLEAVAFETGGAISYPAPYDDGRVLAVRAERPDGATPGTSAIELIRIDRAFDHNVDGDRVEILARLPPGFLASSPARLPDGRVVFIKMNPAGVSDADIGEMMVIGLDNQVRSTGLDGVIALYVVDDKVIFEAGGASGVTDILMTDLDSMPVNITNTQFISEHLGWSS
jgi:hypothetical protein